MRILAKRKRKFFAIRLKRSVFQKIGENPLYNLCRLVYSLDARKLTSQKLMWLLWKREEECFFAKMVD